MPSHITMSALLAVTVAVILPGLALADAGPGVGMILLDSPTRPFLRTQPDSYSSPELHAESVPALLAALLGVPNDSPSSREVAAEVDALTLPSVFHKPAAVVTLNIAGVDADADGNNMEWGLPASLHRVNAASSNVMKGLDGIFYSMDAAVEHLPLDFSAAEGCDAQCVEDAIALMAASIGGTYTKAAECMNGTLQLPAAGSKLPVTLQMSNSAHRLYAMEMSQLHKTVSNVVSGKQSASAAGGTPQFMDCTMMGLQMLRDAHGRDSEEFQAAYQSLSSLTGAMMHNLSQSHDNRVMAQINLLGDVTGDGNAQRSADAMIDWRLNAQPMRARLLQEVDNTTVGDESDGANWSKGALLWVTFWILLWFTWLCVYSLCTMPFQQDTLLYAKGKPE